MHHIKRSGFLKNKDWLNGLRSSYKGLKPVPSNYASDVGFAGFSSLATERSSMSDFSKRAGVNSCYRRESAVDFSSTAKVARHIRGNSIQLRDQWTKTHALFNELPFRLSPSISLNLRRTVAVRCFASKNTDPDKQTKSEAQKEVSTIEDPFDSPTYNIPAKPVTFTEGASYSLIILAGLGIAAAAAYGVFKELIFEPKEYKIFGKALTRIQNENQVKVRIGSPITGYGSESRNRAARQRIPHNAWTDEDGIEHVMVNFHIRGPHGAGKAYAEMFKDKEDKQWKFMYLIVEVTSPSPAQLMLESYVPA